MQIDKEKLLEWIHQSNDELTTNPRRKSLKNFYISADRLVELINSGTFDIKEDTDHADRG